MDIGGLDRPHQRQMTEIPRAALLGARIIGRAASINGISLTEFFWMAPGLTFACSMCDWIYRSSERVEEEICGRELSRPSPEKKKKRYGDDPIPVFCEGRLKKNPYFLDEPSLMAAVYADAVGFIHSGCKNDDDRKAAFDSIFTYDGAKKRKPKILEGIK